MKCLRRPAALTRLAVVTLTLTAVACSSEAQSGGAGVAPEPGGEQTPTSEAAVQLEITSASRSRLLYADSVAWGAEAGGAGSVAARITIDPTERYQTIDGFGYTLTGGSATLLQAMSAPAREALMQELFAPGPVGIGVSYLRISIGASDLDPAAYSYDDVPAGSEDQGLDSFSIAREREFLLPTLREALAINPDLQLMGSPWSPPAWMKDNGATKGGSLRPANYPVYARYLVRYLEAMAAEGVPLDAITVQNEPLHPGNNPSLLMEAADQLTFVRDHLGPAFAKAGLDTKIIVYDHNADRPDYPLTILADPVAKGYVDGSAFHLYAGPMSALTAVHEAHPDRALYFTEQWTDAQGEFGGDLLWHAAELHVGAPRNWSRTVLEWNLASDPGETIHTPGGCTRCLGAVTLDGDAVRRNPAYYSVAHSARWVPTGSVRIGSSEVDGLDNVAYETPDGRTVLLVVNRGAAPRTVAIEAGDRTAVVPLPGASVATVRWE